MIERSSRAIAGEYQRRTEYGTSERAHAAAIVTSLDAIDDVLMVENANELTGVRYSADQHASVTELAVSYIETQEEEPVLFVKGRDMRIRQLERNSVLTDAVIRIESYPVGRHDELADISEVLIEQFIEGEHRPFISRYCIERFYDGFVQTSVKQTDIMQSEGLDERQMLPYDFREFQQQLNVIAAIRKRVLVSDGIGEDEYETDF